MGIFEGVTIENAVVYYRYQEVFYRLDIEELEMILGFFDQKEERNVLTKFSQNTDHIRVGKMGGWVKTKVDESRIDKDVVEKLNSEPTEGVFLLMNKDLTVQFEFHDFSHPDLLKSFDVKTISKLDWSIEIDETFGKNLKPKLCHNSLYSKEKIK